MLFRSIRFSFVSRVSGDLQVLQVTYSTVGEDVRNLIFFKNEQILTHVPTEDVFDLFLLEAAFDDEAAGAVDGARCAHFGEEELDDVFWLIVFFWGG